MFDTVRTLGKRTPEALLPLPRLRPTACGRKGRQVTSGLNLAAAQPLLPCTLAAGCLGAIGKARGDGTKRAACGWALRIRNYPREVCAYYPRMMDVVTLRDPGVSTIMRICAVRHASTGSTRSMTMPPPLAPTT